ncbi:MAG: JAB domain-containing protein [Polyangiales bacterium]
MPSIEPVLTRLRWPDTSTATPRCLRVIGRGRYECRRATSRCTCSPRTTACEASAASASALAPRPRREHRAARMVAAFELARRARCVPSRVARRSGRAATWCAPTPAPLLDAPEERVVAVVLDSRNRPVAERVIARGTTSACALGAREVFTLVVREGGASAIVVHNHLRRPGSPEQDILHLHLAEAGRILDVPSSTTSSSRARAMPCSSTPACCARRTRLPRLLTLAVIPRAAHARGTRRTTPYSPSRCSARPGCGGGPRRAEPEG